MPKPVSLSYALNKKTDKLIKTHGQKNADLLVMVPSGIVSFLLWWYFFNNINRFMSGWISDSSVDATLATSDKIVFTLVLLSTAIFAFFYSLWTRHNEKLKKYKKEIWEIIQLEPCLHKYPCNCVDDYCHWVEKELGIDLI